jgi:hypothetical protein
MRAGASHLEPAVKLSGDPERPLESPPDHRPHWLYRLVVGLFLCMHGWMVVGSLANERDWGKQMRAKTRTYERALGIHQNWSMFAPNAPRSSVWMKVEADAVWDEVVEIEPPVGGPLPGPFEWHYRRLGKLERLGVKKSHSDIRRVLAKTWCKRLDEQKMPVKTIRIHQYWQPTPTMAQRRRGKMPKVKNKLRQEIKCRL